MLENTNLIVRLSDLQYRTVAQVIAENPLSGLVVPYQLHEGYAWSLETFPPEHDAATHCAVLDTPIQNGDGDWLQAWRIEALTEEQLTERAAALHDEREKARQRITDWRDAQEAGGIVFEHAGRAWDGGLTVRRRMQPMLALPGLPDGFFWTDADNNDVQMTLIDLGELSAAHELAIVNHGFDIHKRQRFLKATVDALESMDALKTFVPGWPPLEEAATQE